MENVVEDKTPKADKVNNNGKQQKKSTTSKTARGISEKKPSNHKDDEKTEEIPPPQRQVKINHRRKNKALEYLVKDEDGVPGTTVGRSHLKSKTQE